MACHPRDAINWVVNRLAGADWEIAPVSMTAPLLTSFGVLIGAFAAARRHRERRPLSLGRPVRSLLFGVLAMNAAIIALGCPTRLLLLSAYGEALAVVGVAGLIAGIVLGTWLLRTGVVD
jgi:hypothetical protein